MKFPTTCPPPQRGSSLQMRECHDVLSPNQYEIRRITHKKPKFRPTMIRNTRWFKHRAKVSSRRCTITRPFVASPHAGGVVTCRWRGHNNGLWDRVESDRVYTCGWWWLSSCSVVQVQLSSGVGEAQKLDSVVISPGLGILVSGCRLEQIIWEKETMSISLFSFYTRYKVVSISRIC